VEPRTIEQIELPTELSTPEDRTAEIVVASLDTLTRVHTFVEDIEIALDASPLDVVVMRTEDGYAVEVTARSLARDVTLLADRAAVDLRSMMLWSRARRAEHHFPGPDECSRS
jgi:beta-mannosidase